MKDIKIILPQILYKLVEFIVNPMKNSFHALRHPILYFTTLPDTKAEFNSSLALFWGAVTLWVTLGNIGTPEVQSSGYLISYFPVAQLTKLATVITIVGFAFYFYIFINIRLTHHISIRYVSIFSCHAHATSLVLMTVTSITIESGLLYKIGNENLRTSIMIGCGLLPALYVLLLLPFQLIFSFSKTCQIGFFRVFIVSVTSFIFSLLTYLAGMLIVNISYKFFVKALRVLLENLYFIVFRLD